LLKAKIPSSQREDQEHADDLERAPAALAQRRSDGVLRAGFAEAVEPGGELAQRAVVVDVGDGDRREALAQDRDELRRRQRAAAEFEEVALGGDR
jgi:hypothetical protein